MKSKKFSDNYKDNYKPIKLHPINCSLNDHIHCDICNKTFKSMSGMATHVLRKHRIDLNTYIHTYFVNLKPEFTYEKCGFCNNIALPTTYIDIPHKTYYLEYDNGYNCFTIECINNVCLDFFGKPYCECIKKYEHIGSKMSYLSKLYKKDSAELKDLKWAPAKNKLSRSTSLKGYIYRNGEELGRKKYQERCDKIRKTLKVEWFIERYGIEEGIKKYEERQRKFISNASNITHSKNQFRIFDALHLIDDNWNAERYAGGIGMVDMLNLDKRIAIEYFGDYWHCNPEIYPSTFYNKNLKCRAFEKQAKDKDRIAKILNDKRISLVIVIWEKTFITLGFDAIMSKLQDIFNRYDITRKEAIWI